MRHRLHLQRPIRQTGKGNPVDGLAVGGAYGSRCFSVSIGSNRIRGSVLCSAGSDWPHRFCFGKESHTSFSRVDFNGREFGGGGAAARVERWRPELSAGTVHGSRPRLLFDRLTGQRNQGGLDQQGERWN